MSNLSGQKIIVGVTGGIAAYKSCELIRRLADRGALVKVVMTPGAEAFVTPLTFQALSGSPVHTDLLDPEAEAGMGHIELARWADKIVIAPATANFLARLSQGRAEDLLSTVCLAAKADISVAPSMNQAMWINAATQKNLSLIEQLGINIVGPDSGDQACGDIGLGRMTEPMKIIAALELDSASNPLTGKKVVITAGPTLEALDPVRYLSNHSSGKMGYAIAMASVRAGAETVLVSGPVNLDCPLGVKRIEVTSCAEMQSAAMAEAAKADVFIATAAVADYRPEQASPQKIKKHGNEMAIKLVRNPDILAKVAALGDHLFCVGFAAESEKLIENASKKLISKNLNLIVANDISDQSIGFGSDENAVTLIGPDFELELGKSHKRLIARKILEVIGEEITK
ncbi:MAG: bifunctional phosphopantothenoylcysteine decarboxylase/phosphopantothenate--cysteine ligase CoaBC [Porticoccaceae bacterium]|jgi:phosphopantothenoylcysteine decarboxylase / phosphopantothenate---cysteine ligase|nr:bifunctional phosphopantothenoylcysteine decarboxylase/phosphopantothenate--cysteine ligase CoaBC [Porticoccaceae bacterium]